MLPVSDFKSIENKRSFNLIGKIKVKIVLIVAGLVISLFFTQLVFANGLATSGLKLVQIENDINRLDAENRILRNEIAKESSLVALSQKADDLGFKKSPKAIIP